MQRTEAFQHLLKLNNYSMEATSCRTSCCGQKITGSAWLSSVFSIKVAFLGILSLLGHRQQGRIYATQCALLFDGSSQPVNDTTPEQIIYICKLLFEMEKRKKTARRGWRCFDPCAGESKCMSTSSRSLLKSGLHHQYTLRWFTFRQLFAIIVYMDVHTYTYRDRRCRMEMPSTNITIPVESQVIHQPQSFDADPLAGGPPSTHLADVINTIFTNATYIDIPNRQTIVIIILL